jgi:hypothetical protein
MATATKITVMEAVAVFREHGFFVSRVYVWRCCRAGRIPSVAVANRLWMERDDVEQFIAEQADSSRVVRVRA